MRFWEDSEVEILKKNYNSKSDEELSDLLNRSVSSIKNKRYQLGLLKNRKLFKNIYNFYKDDKLIMVGSIEVIAAETNRKIKTVLSYTSKNSKRFKLELVDVVEPDFALYKGEEILAIGTTEEIAEQMNIKPATVQYYGAPMYIREAGENCRILIELEED